VISLENDFDLPYDAVPYILLQRMDTQKFRNLRYTLPFGRTLYNLTYNQFLYRLEARLREDEIKRQYLDEMQTEYESIKDHLPDSASSILDIGCGIAGINLYLSRHYKEDDPTFYLFDKTKVSDSVYYQFKDEAAFYNSLNVAVETLKSNNIREDNIQALDADEFDLTTLDDIDLCISLISWAFHYPLDTYLEQVLDCLAPDGSLLLDIRKETGQFDEAAERFKEYDVIENTEKYRRTIFTAPIKDGNQGTTDPTKEPATSGH
jgi:SAM-dependent methyltransferase